MLMNIAHIKKCEYLSVSKVLVCETPSEQVGKNDCNSFRIMMMKNLSNCLLVVRNNMSAFCSKFRNRPDSVIWISSLSIYVVRKLSLEHFFSTFEFVAKETQTFPKRV